MVLGARTKNNKGCFLLYKSSDIYNLEFISMPAGQLENMGYMWECPDIFKLDNRDVLLLSPQGMEADVYKYNNLYQCGYVIGEFTNNKKEFLHKEFVELERKWKCNIRVLLNMLT